MLGGLRGGGFFFIPAGSESIEHNKVNKDKYIYNIFTLQIGLCGVLYMIYQ